MDLTTPALQRDIALISHHFSRHNLLCTHSHCLTSTSSFVPPRICSWNSFSCRRPRILARRPPCKRQIACRAITEATPESNDNRGKDEEETEYAQSPPLTDALVRSNNEHLDSNNPAISEDRDDSGSAEMVESENKLKNDDDDDDDDNIQEKDGDLEVSSGSPLPGMKQYGELIKVPKATIDILRDQVFGFDSFFVTGQEPYEGGVLFKGNLRGKATTSYEKLSKRMQDKFGDQYKLFLLINPEDDKPVAVVVPKQTLLPESTAVPEWFAAGAFGLVTLFTLLLRNVPALQSNLLSTFDNLEMLKEGLPGALVTTFVLVSHEVGHLLVARDIGVKLGVPYFVPSWQIGSFGAITRIVSIVSNRQDLLKLAVAGPMAGFLLGFTLFLLGFILPPNDGIGIVVDSAIFHESFLAGGVAKLLLGDALKEGAQLSVNPLVLWAWAGLLINAINSIPAGELDGGRISFALWGRKVSTRLTGVTLALLGVSSFFSDVAFYWAVLLFFLQRGPIAPLSEEISEPENNYIGLGITVLLLGLLVCLPYPFPFTTDRMSFDL
ncbi:Peptidase M50 domain-containing protein [Dioscorea alata]|uniref:Peptidase M50 domain-containing protein n=1 Tax=Dioscorea alata TaxID=55571 RepID=A0ACB7VUC2_DIOAL|nr:Peptidase M50 domain-containing protein [Dioscorea alata]